MMGVVRKLARVVCSAIGEVPRVAIGIAFCKERCRFERLVCLSRGSIG